METNTIKQVVLMLKTLKLQIATAESCTGGLLSSLITSQEGASEIFQTGIVSYSNKTKMDILKVDPKILDMYTAVSEECAHAMALGIKELTGADVCVSITGYASFVDDNTPMEIYAEILCNNTTCSVIHIPATGLTLDRNENREKIVDFVVCKLYELLLGMLSSMQRIKKYNCPKCEKELINLSLDRGKDSFWCDDCNIDILFDYNEGDEL